MRREEILERMKGVMEEAATEPIDWSKVDESSSLEGLGFDSLAILDVLYGVEQEFELEVDAEEVTDVETLGELLTALEERIEP
ncbi:MAG: phosphopantetheine-binding protein [Thermoanaerobaculia bacterium]